MRKALVLASLFSLRFAHADQVGVALVLDSPAKSSFAKELAGKIGQSARVVALEPTLKALTALGHVGPPGKFLGVNPAPAADIDRACKVAERLLADYTVAVQRRFDKKRIAHVVLIKASPCKVVEEKDLTLPVLGDVKEAEIVGTEIALMLGAGGENPVAATVTPKANDPVKTETPDDGSLQSDRAGKRGDAPKDEPTAPVVPDRFPREPLAYIEVGPSFGIRRFTYENLKATNLFEFRTNQPIFSVRAHGDVFPWARQGGFLGAIGFGGEAGHSVGAGSTVPGAKSLSAGLAPSSVDTDWTWFDLYAQLRLRLRHGSSLSFRAGYGHTSFTFSAPPSETRLPPSATYAHIRFGPRADLRFLRKITVHASADFLQVLDAGTASNRFANPSSIGLEMSAGAGYLFSERFELYARASYARFSTSFLALNGTDASGSTDQFGRADIVGRFAF